MVVGDRVDELVGAPLGRAVVAELVGLDVQRLAAQGGIDLGGVRYDSAGISARPPGARTPGDAGPLDARQVRSIREVVGRRVHERVGRWLPPAPLGLCSPGDVVDLLRRVGQVTENIAFGGASQWLAIAPVLDQVNEQLRPAAAELVAHPGAAWWWSTAPLGAQRWCGPPPAPEAGDAWWTGTEGDSVDRAGCWWVSPPGIATTRATPDGACVRTHCREGHTSYVEPGTEVIAPVSGIERARVYEVATAADWVDLVDAYPRPTPAGAHEQWSRWSGHHGPWYLPDWGRCAREWDAVHISAGAYLSAAYRALPTRGGATFLAGWDPDQSAWLTTALTIGTPTASPSP